MMFRRQSPERTVLQRLEGPAQDRQVSYSLNSFLLAIVSCHTWHLSQAVGTWDAAYKMAVKAPLVNEMMLPYDRV